MEHPLATTPWPHSPSAFPPIRDVLWYLQLLVELELLLVVLIQVIHTQGRRQTHTWTTTAPTPSTPLIRPSIRAA